MQQTDFGRFKAIMAGMAKLYEKELEPILLDVYWLALRDWTLGEFESAAGQLMRTQTFMPRPAEFMALKRAAQPTAGEAWARVLQHLKGAYRAGWLTPEIDRAVAPLGGYRALAMMPTDELHWQEKRFAEHYADMAEAGETRESLANTPGWLQIQAHGAKALSKR